MKVSALYNLLPVVFLCLICQVLSLQSSGQTKGSLSIKVQTSRKEPVPFATIRIRSGNDTVYNESQVADSNGKTEFRLPVNLPVIITVSAVNFSEQERSFFYNSKTNLYTIVLQSGTKTLQDVVSLQRNP